MTLVGARVVLREAQVEDAAAMVRYHVENRAHHAPWMPHAPPEMFTLPFWQTRLAAYEVDRAHGRTLRLLVLHQDELIGLVQLRDVLRAPIWSASLGYSLAESVQGHGYMTEALRLVIGHAFGAMGLHRLTATYDVRNARSARVVGRCGFSVEGTLPAFMRCDGRWCDHEQVSLIHHDWQPPSG